MAISIGTFDDLRGSRGQPIDRNPSIDCAGCGESHGWRDYQNWHDEITPETELLCPACQRERQRLRRRRENNEPLTRFASSTGGDE